MAASPEPANRQNSSPACPLSYPDRFHAATTFVARVPESTFTNETRLLFYALHKQATDGPCTEGKPWSWNVVESAKWQSWSQLGSMTHMDAMRLYVKTLDEEQPEWWTRLPEEAAVGSPDAAAAAEAAAAAAGAGGAAADARVSISSVFQEGTWVVIQQDDAKKPLPRYEQGAALMGPNLYVMGGHYSGRYLADMWAYNLNKLAWSAASGTASSGTAQQPAEGQAAAQQQQQQQQQQEEAAPLLAAGAPPPAAGWSVTPLQDNKMLVMGGHSKVGKLRKGESLPPMPVWVVDLDVMTWTPLATTGQTPSARGGHTACPLPDDKIVVYGGEDSHRRPLADVYVLDLQEFTWSKLDITSKQQPAARSSHVAALCNGSNMLVFGGGSIASCFNDLWVLDLSRGAWSKPEVVGASPTPRAGHGGALVGDALYVLGGGNNVKGCTEMLVADLSELTANKVSWSRVCNVPAGSPLSSEGISLLHSPEYNMLVAFGGYNGKYHNAVSVYKLPSGGLLQGSAKQPATPSQAEQPQQQPQQQPQGQAQAQQQQAQQPEPQQAQQEAQLQQQQQQRPGQGTPGRQESDAAAANGSPLANGGKPLSGHEQSLLKELALSREQLKRDLAAARQELELVAGAADASKEEAAAQVNMLVQQLGAAQQRAEEAEKAAEDARAALSAEQAKTLKLEAQLAELSDKLGTVQDLEKELAKYRLKESEDAKKKGSGTGLWAYMAGAS